MSDAPHLTLKPAPDATPEGELTALTAIYHRAIQRYEEKQKCGPETAPDDGGKFKEDSADAVRK